MATAQERADAAYRAYRAAAERLAVAQRIGLNPQVAAAALAKAEADSHAANDALRATYPKAPPTGTETYGRQRAPRPPVHRSPRGPPALCVQGDRGGIRGGSTPWPATFLRGIARN